MQSTQIQVTGPVTAPASVSRTLRDAACYLAKYGWVQGCYYDPAATVFTPAACVVGAIGMVCYGGPVESPAHQYDDPGFDDFTEALGFLEYHLATTCSLATDAYAFNDTRGRTAAAVIALLHEAADAWDQASADSVDELVRLLDEATHPWQQHTMAGGGA